LIVTLMEKHAFIQSMDWATRDCSPNDATECCIFEGMCCFRLLDADSKIVFFKHTSEMDDSTQLTLKLYVIAKKHRYVVAMMDGLSYRIDISWISKIILHSETATSTPPYIEWHFPTIAFRYYSHKIEPRDILIRQLESSIKEILSASPSSSETDHSNKRPLRDKQEFMLCLRAYIHGQRHDLNWIPTHDG
jgi:hypothetical protein